MFFLLVGELWGRACLIGWIEMLGWLRVGIRILGIGLGGLGIGGPCRQGNLSVRCVDELFMFRRF